MNRKSNKPALAAAGIAGTLLLAGTAFASTPLAQGYMLGAAHDHGDHAHDASHGIGQMDTDKDGRVSAAEFAAAHDGDDSRFAAHDRDGDGFISAAELDAHHAALEDGKDKKAGMEGKCGEGKCGGM